MTGKQQANAVVAKVLTAAMGVESDVAPPPRARSSSFASTVSDLNVGDPPASKVQMIDNTLTVADALAQMSDAGERLRNSVTSSVAQAKRKNVGAEYSVEITDIKTKSGIYSLALIHRTA
jgi:hypothetical protein